MKRCWDETFEKRPDFSFLVHCVGDMLTDSYKKVLHLYIKLLFALQLVINPTQTLYLNVVSL